jgi:RNA-binding protein NOB1
VIEFAKKTGDYPSLSAVDLKVLALAYTLEMEVSGGKKLRADPVRPVTQLGGGNASARPPVPQSQSALNNQGFFYGGDVQAEKEAAVQEEQQHNLVEEETVLSGSVAETSSYAMESTVQVDAEAHAETEQSPVQEEQTKEIEEVDENTTPEATEKKKRRRRRRRRAGVSADGAAPNSATSTSEAVAEPIEELATELSNKASISSKAEDIVIEDDEEEGWITPKNVARVKQRSFGGKVSHAQAQPAAVPVACITTDFAMQVSCCPVLRMFISWQEWTC